jgi:hypothetical protein
MISDLDYKLILDISMSSIFILLRVEVNLFVLSPEIEDRDEVEVGEAQRDMHNDICILFYLQADHKKKSNMNSFIFFCCSDSKMTIFKFYGTNS